MSDLQALRLWLGKRGAEFALLHWHSCACLVTITVKEDRNREGC